MNREDVPSSSAAAESRMSGTEIRALLSLGSLFGLRMLGLFLILPVFAVHALKLKGGENHTMVGIALGAYGLTQGIFQIPFGMASDRYGRKRTIVVGLVLFAIGSFVAAAATDIYTVIAGRTIQGLGAIAAPVLAFAADVTREQHRTKAMAAIGASIGFVFATSMVAAPALYRVIGMAGIFGLTGILSILAIYVTLRVVPEEPTEIRDMSRRVQPGALGRVLKDRELLRTNFGIFTVHTLQMSMFVVVPVSLVRYSGLPLVDHWKVYLPVVLLSFVLMVPPILYAERRKRIKTVFLATIGAMALIEAALALELKSFYGVVAVLVAFFVAFNVLEATLPSIVTRISPPSTRGTALGVYNTTQALGLFVGGALGGWLTQHFGGQSVFVFGIALVALWFLIAAGMRSPNQVQSRTFSLGEVGDPAALRERLICLRGVRDAVLIPEKGVAHLTFYADVFDERAATKLIGGEV